MDNKLFISLILTAINTILTISNYFFSRKTTSVNGYSKFLTIKLELIYSPLQIELKENKELILVDNLEFINNFHKYSYLLENNFCDLIIDTINLENSIKKFNCSEYYHLVEKHTVNLKKLSQIVNDEYAKYSSLYKKIYEKTENELSKPYAYRLLLNLINFCYYVFIFSCMILGPLFYANSSMEKSYSSNLISSFSNCFLIVNFLGFIFSLIKIIHYVVEKLTDKN